MNVQTHTRSPAKRVLLAETQTHLRESLVNQVLMAGAGQVAVAVDAEELIRSLNADSYDLVLLGQSIFVEKQVKKELETFHRKRSSSIIVLFDDEEKSLRAHKMLDVLKENNVYLCVLRSTAARILKIILNE